VIVEDLLRGKVIFDITELDDLIIQRTDGTPTYNFVVVVDDSEMGITHVVRGDDHLSNTPRQCLLYDALEYTRPQFSHISMILGKDKSRLSKRHGATSALAYRDMGYLPDAMINYLARLGWSHGDQEIFSREELIKHFSFDSVNTSAAIFDADKLSWVNEQYIQSTPPEELAKHLEPHLIKSGVLPEGHGLSAQEIAKVIPCLNQRAKTLIEMAEKSAFFFKKEVEFDEKARNKFLTDEAKPLLEKVIAGFSTLDDFSAESIESLFKKIVEEEGMKLGKLAQPVRVALTGTTVSPGIYDVILLLGKEETLKRLQDVI
jgi:glutamyl-tRNA synthetase